MPFDRLATQYIQKLIKLIQNYKSSNFFFEVRRPKFGLLAKIHTRFGRTLPNNVQSSDIFNRLGRFKIRIWLKQRGSGSLKFDFSKFGGGFELWKSVFLILLTLWNWWRNRRTITPQIIGFTRGHGTYSRS